ncbi:MAG: hypothetical protein RDV48_01365 [Candidatus Eremiobacteraeota bacterium]|nr:hypothetical protein [Candidatus Eremiobacteraeota bacterium]
MDEVLSRGTLYPQRHFSPSSRESAGTTLKAPQEPYAGDDQLLNQKNSANLKLKTAWYVINIDDETPAPEEMSERRDARESSSLFSYSQGTQGISFSSYETMAPCGGTDNALASIALQNFSRSQVPPGDSGPGNASPDQQHQPFNRFIDYGDEASVDWD